MNNIFEVIYEQVCKIPLLDTHEHLIDESERLGCTKPFIPCDDWTTIFGLYSKFDFVSAGMSKNEIDSISSPDTDPLEKWKIMEPYNEHILAKVTKLSDWLEIINWWFDKYADRAVGVKIGIAFFRRLDFQKIDIDIANRIMWNNGERIYEL